MAIQILPRSQGFGELLGQNFGQGLGMLAQHKLNQLYENKALDRLKNMGVSEQDAQFIAALPPQQQLQALNLLWAQIPQQESLSQIAQSLSGFGSLPDSTQSAMALQQLPKGFQSLPLSEMLSQLSSGQGMPSVQQQEQFPQEAVLPQSAEQQMQQRPSLRGGIQAAQQRALNAASSKEQAIRQKEIDKETLPVYDKIVAEKEVADASSKRLNKMENLIKAGNLPPSALYRFLKGLEETSSSTGAQAGGIIGSAAGGVPGAVIGAGIGGLIGPIASALRAGQGYAWKDSEQFEKLSNDFIRDAKGIFGARITDSDLQAFLQMIPTLAQSDNGKKAIINNMKMFNEASQVKYKNMKKIIHENGGRRPENLSILIEERSRPELDKLSKRFEIV